MPAARRPIQKSTLPSSIINPKDPVPRMPEHRELGSGRKLPPAVTNLVNGELVPQMVPAGKGKLSASNADYIPPQVDPLTGAKSQDRLREHREYKPKPPEEIKFTGPYLVEVTLDNDKAPISGHAHYIVVDENRHSTQLLYPWTLEHFTIPTVDFQRGQGLIYWPFDKRTAPEHEKLDAGKLSQRMYDRLVTCLEDKKRHYNTTATLELVAALRGVPVGALPVIKTFEEEDQPYVKKIYRGAVQRAEGGFKPVGIIATIKELLVEGKTEDEFVAVLAERFPDRRAEGMRTTVKCQVRRDLIKKGLPIKRKEVTGRGLVFYL